MMYATETYYQNKIAEYKMMVRELRMEAALAFDAGSDVGEVMYPWQVTDVLDRYETDN
jgi:hypothetical protein